MARTKNEKLVPHGKPSKKGSKKAAPKALPKAPKKDTVLKPVVTKTLKFKPGTVTVRDFKKFNLKKDFLISKMAFRRVVRGIFEDLPQVKGASKLRVQESAMMAIQEATEAHLVHSFENAMRCATHGKRVTVQPRDMQLARYLAGGTWLGKY